jgi:hypothetical protein
MDRLIVAYFDVDRTVTNTDIFGMRVADEGEAQAIEAGFISSYEILKNDVDALNTWKRRLNVDELPELVTYISDNADDIRTLQEAGHFIDGWDREFNRFILRASATNIKRYIVTKKLNQIDREYRTQRTLADAISGDAWAKSRLVEAENLCIPLRVELAGITEE